jgi:hypothetical protein
MKVAGQTAGMARVGELHRVFRTFLNLKKVSLSLYSDSSGNCLITLRVTAPGNGYQTFRRGSGPSRSQEATAPTAAAATAPAPTRNARRHVDPEPYSETKTPAPLLLGDATRQGARHGGAKQ